MINFLQPALGQDELAAIADVFASNWIGRGSRVIEFERRFAQGLAADPEKFLSATCCTEGLFLAPHLYELAADDEVIVPSVSFIAVGSCVVASGARLVFCDVDPRTLNATPEIIESKLTKRTRAIVLNHYGGIPCDMDPILELCRSRGILVIEDTACALRSFYKGRACGTMADMGLWSFDAMKTLTTGDGGMIYIASQELATYAREYLYLGLPSRKKSGVDSAAGGVTNWWEITINCPGRRAIMNDVAGAIGLTQLAKLDGFIARRKQIYDAYCEQLAGLDWLELPPPVPSYVQPSHYFFWVQLEKRDQLARFLLERGVYTTFRYWPLHKVEYFKASEAVLPGSELASRRTLNLPLHQSLSAADVQRVVDAIREFGSRHA